MLQRRLRLRVRKALRRDTCTALEQIPKAPKEHSRSVMTKQYIIRRFESDNLAGEFHHADHIRLAFAYLTEFPVLEALGRFSAALKRYAAARGKAELYHEAITHAYFFL